MERFHEILSTLAVLLLVAQRLLALVKEYMQWRKERANKRG